MGAARRSLSGLLAGAIVVMGCSGSPSSSRTMTPAPPPAPTSPTPPASPTVPDPPPRPPASVAGKWSGTIESTNFATRRISVLAFQDGTCVDGAWGTQPNEWAGAISGLADGTSFSGSVTFERAADGPGKCGGIGTFSGDVEADTITWTSTGFTGECAGGLPASVTITLARE